MPAATATPSQTPSRPSHGRHDECQGARVRRCLRVFFGHLFSNLGLFALVVGYVLLGAILFEFLEAGYELEQRSHIQQSREECLKELWLITERLNVLYEKNWTRLVHEQLRNFEASVVSATKVEGYDGKDVMDNDRQWSFSGAMLYSVTVITTIGYGNLTPKTQSGKVVTMLYALFGVPLMLMCLSNLGSLLAGTFQFAYSHKCCSSCGHQGNHRGNTQKQQHHCLYDKQRTPSCSQYQRRPSRAPSYSSCQQQNKNDAIPPPPLVTCTINPRGSGRLIQARPRPRPLTPEVRKILTECAEYTLAQESPSPDPGATRMLRELRDPEAGAVPEEDEGQDEEEDVEADDRDDGDIEHCATIHDTPSRVPLIYRPHVEPHLHKRPPTPPPRRSRPDSNSSDQNTEDQHKVQVPVTIVLLVLVLYICLGAIVFSAWEGWTFLDGAYFCFVTLSTIGFGDMVPGKSLKSTDTQHGQLQLVACCAYLLLGLVLIAMSFTLVQEEVLVKCRQVAYFVGILKKVEPH